MSRLTLDTLAAFEASKRRPPVRRAERCIGLAIRKGQAEGRIAKRGDIGGAQVKGTRGAKTGSIRGGDLERASRFLTTPNELTGAYAMADNVSEEAFEPDVMRRLQPAGGEK